MTKEPEANLPTINPESEGRELWAEFRIRVFAFPDTMNLAREDAVDEAFAEAGKAVEKELAAYRDLRIETL